MSRLRLIMLSVVAVLAVSAMSSASASAFVKCNVEESKELTWCIEKGGVTEELLGEETFTSKGGASSIKAAITVECKKETDSGAIIQADSGIPEISDVEIIFKECAVVGNPKCVVQDPVLKKAGELQVGPEVDGEVVAIGGKAYAKFSDSEGKEKFIAIEVLNKGAENCLVKGTYEVTGKACGEVSAGLAVAPTLTFSKAVEETCKTELKLKGVKAVFTDTKEVTLSGPNKGNKWGIAES